MSGISIIAQISMSLSFYIRPNVDKVMIGFADRGHPLNSICRGWNICEKKVKGFIELPGDIYYLC